LLPFVLHQIGYLGDFGSRVNSIAFHGGLMCHCEDRRKIIEPGPLAFQMLESVLLYCGCSSLWDLSHPLWVALLSWSSIQSLNYWYFAHLTQTSPSYLLCLFFRYSLALRNVSWGRFRCHGYYHLPTLYSLQLSFWTLVFSSRSLIWIALNSDRIQVL